MWKELIMRLGINIKKVSMEYLEESIEEIDEAISEFYELKKEIQNEIDSRR